LDIVIWIPRAGSVSEVSALSRKLFHEAGKNNLHLAVAELPCSFFNLEENGIRRDRDTVTCLRSVLMKPDHLEWLGRIWEILDASSKNIGI
jgi:hypothetical protein